MSTNDSNMINMSRQLVVAAEVETSLQTLVPGTPTLAPNSNHASREQANLESQNLDPEAENWMMKFCQSVQKQNQVMLAQNENISRNTENMGKKQDQLAHELMVTQENMAKIGEVTLKLQNDNHHHNRIIEQEMGKIQARVADTQNVVTENRAGVMMLEQNLKEVENKGDAFRNDPYKKPPVEFGGSQTEEMLIGTEILKSISGDVHQRNAIQNGPSIKQDAKSRMTGNEILINDPWDNQRTRNERIGENQSRRQESNLMGGFLGENWPKILRGKEPEIMIPEESYSYFGRNPSPSEKRQESYQTPNFEQNPEYRFEPLGRSEQSRGQPRHESHNHAWQQNWQNGFDPHRENARMHNERDDRFDRTQEKERARKAKQEDQDEAIRRILRETSKSGKITNTPPRLRDYGTYQAWRQKIVDWAMFEGKVAGSALILKIIRTIREDPHEKSQTAKAILEETWDETLQQSHDINHLELIDFLKRLDVKMELPTQIQIEKLEKKWYHFQKNCTGSTVYVVKKLKELVEDLDAMGKEKTWHEVLRKLRECQCFQGNNLMMLMLGDIVEGPAWEKLIQKLSIVDQQGPVVMTLQHRDHQHNKNSHKPKNKGKGEKVKLTSIEPEPVYDEYSDCDDIEEGGQYEEPWEEEEEENEDEWSDESDSAGFENEQLFIIDGKENKKGKGKAKGKGKSKGKGKATWYKKWCWWCEVEGQHTISQCEGALKAKEAMNKENEKLKRKKEQSCKVIKSTNQNKEDQGNDQVSTIVEIRGIKVKTENLYWTYQTNNLGAILDTGFTGRAVCSKNWLNQYQRFLEPHGGTTFKIEEAEACNYLFGQGKSVQSVSTTNIPIWNGISWMMVKTRLIEGDLDLILGSTLMSEMQVKIDVAKNKICYKDGKWIKTVLSNHGHSILPAPTQDDFKLMKEQLKEDSIKKRIKKRELKVMEWEFDGSESENNGTQSTQLD